MGYAWAEPVKPGILIKAAHVNELRSHIQTEMMAVPVGSRYPFNWSSVSTSSPILASHFTDMKAAIQLLWLFKVRGDLPRWSSGIVPGGASTGQPPTFVRASDITDLRMWLNQYVDNHPFVPQGITSFSYDPASGNLSRINQTWKADIFRLTSQPLQIRCVVTGKGNPIGLVPLEESDYTNYLQAFQVYQDSSMWVYATFNANVYDSFDKIIGGDDDPNKELINGTNPYITEYAKRVGEAITKFSVSVISPVIRFIIWNEPNVGGPNPPHPRSNINYMDGDRFAAMMWNVYRQIRDVYHLVTIYWGGIQFGHAVGSSPDQNALDYIDSVYAAAAVQRRPGEPLWPWDGLNMHLHDVYPAGQVNNAVAAVRARMASHGQANNPLIIGEWGVQGANYLANPASFSTAFGAIDKAANKPDLMFFFSHQYLEEGDGSEWGLVHWDSSTGVFAITGPTFGNPPEIPYIEAYYDALMGT